MASWIGATCSTSPSRSIAWSSEQYASSVVHGVKATNVGASVKPASRHSATARSKSRSRVPLLELVQHVIVYRLDGARDERAARVAQNGQRVGVGEQVLDLDRDVVRDLRKLRMERARDGNGVADAVEEVRIAERDVSGARGDLRLGRPP